MSTPLKPFIEMVKKQNFTILDTETTGLKNAEICQIAIIRSTGEILLDTLVKPTKPIPHDAWRIHGISDETVKDAEGWGSVGQEVYKILSKHENVVVYNAVFDRHMIYSSEEHVGIEKQNWNALTTWWCAMNAYAEIFGDWNEYHQSYKWVRLATAANNMNVDASNLHSALGDCQTTLALVQAMALTE